MWLLPAAEELVMDYFEFYCLLVRGRQREKEVEMEKPTLGTWVLSLLFTYKPSGSCYLYRSFHSLMLTVG